MPQLQPVAAATVVIAVLMAILVTTVTVQVRARRRRTRLAEMMRAIVPAPIPVPIPRSAVSSVTTTTLEAPIAATPSPASPPSSLRGNDYSRAEREARFSAFDERSSTREAAPGRPARRLAAQERPMSVAPAVEAPLPAPAAAPIERVEPPQAPSTSVRHVPMQTHGGLASVILDVDVPTAIAPSMSVVAPVPVAAVEVAVEERVLVEGEPEQAASIETPPAPPAHPRDAPRGRSRAPGDRAGASTGGTGAAGADDARGDPGRRGTSAPEQPHDDGWPSVTSCGRGGRSDVSGGSSVRDPGP